MSKFDVLVGNTVRRVFVSKGEAHIAFVTDGGTFAFETEADCCSETWFADLNGFAFLKDTRVNRVEDFELPPEAGEDGRTRQERDDVMGVRIRTYRGTAEILYRNSSNGYYGGSVERVYVPASLDGWTEITEDWRA